MTVPRESAVRASILRALRGVPGLKAVPYVATQGGEAGTPDIIGCYRGRMFALEVKRHGGRTSPIQQVRIRQWLNAGAIAGVVRSADETLALLSGVDRWAESD